MQSPTSIHRQRHLKYIAVKTQHRQRELGTPELKPFWNYKFQQKVQDVTDPFDQFLNELCLLLKEGKSMKNEFFVGSHWARSDEIHDLFFTFFKEKNRNCTF